MDVAHLFSITDVQQLREIVVEKMAEIAQRDERIAQRDALIASRDRTIAWKAAKIEKLTREIRNRPPETPCGVAGEMISPCTASDGAAGRQYGGRAWSAGV